MVSKDNQPRVGAIIVAAGASHRMAGVDKVFAMLAGEPLIKYSLRAFQEVQDVDTVVLVLSDAQLERGYHLVDGAGLTKVSAIVPGGSRRQDSVANGLNSLRHCDVVMVHDGARPLVDHDIIYRGLDAMIETGAASAAIPVTDTVKISGGDMVVSSTLDRRGLWAAQTPQVFRSGLLMEAHDAVGVDVTDDAAMVEALGEKVKLFLGSYNNIKVTTPQDMTHAEAILAARQRTGYS